MHLESQRSGGSQDQEFSLTLGYTASMMLAGAAWTLSHKTKIKTQNTAVENKT